MLLKYAGIIVAVLVIAIAIVAGVFHVLPTSDVQTIVQDAIVYVLGHLVGLGSAMIVSRDGKKFAS